VGKGGEVRESTGTDDRMSTMGQTADERNGQRYHTVILKFTRMCD